MAEQTLFSGKKKKLVVHWDDIVGRPNLSELGSPSTALTAIPDFHSVIDWEFEEVQLLDTNQSNHLSLVWNEGETLDRVLNLKVGGEDRTIDLDASLDIDCSASAKTFNVNIGNDNRILTLGGDASFAFGVAATVKPIFTQSGESLQTLTFVQDANDWAIDVKADFYIEAESRIDQDLTVDSIVVAFAGLSLTAPLVMNANNITGVDDLEVTSISERVGSTGITFNNNMHGGSNNFDGLGIVTATTFTDGTWSTTAGAFTGVASFGTPTSITMAEDGWIGIGVALERFVFDGTGGKIDVLGAVLGMNANSITGVNDIQVTSISERIGAAGILFSDPLNGGIIFNELGADVDHRFESSGNINMLFVDGGANKVGIGRVPTTLELEVQGSFKSYGANNRNFSVVLGDNRIQDTDGGGWIVSYGFIGQSGTDYDGFGGFLTNDTLNYYYVGTAFNNFGLKVDASSDVSIPNNLYVDDISELTGAHGVVFGSHIFATGVNALSIGTAAAPFNLFYAQTLHLRDASENPGEFIWVDNSAFVDEYIFRHEPIDSGTRHDFMGYRYDKGRLVLRADSTLAWGDIYFIEGPLKLANTIDILPEVTGGNDLGDASHYFGLGHINTMNVATVLNADNIAELTGANKINFDDHTFHPDAIAAYFGSTGANIGVDGVDLIVEPGTGEMRVNGHTHLNGSAEVTGGLEVDSKGKMTTIGGYAVKLTNKTGGNTVAGQLVIASTGTTDAFATAGANEDNVIGAVLDAGVADGAEAWVVTGGIADVLMDGGGSEFGDRIISSSTAGSADVWNVGGAVATHFLEIGHCLETRIGAGLARINIHFN